MRQIVGARKVRKLSQSTGLPVRTAMVRGGTKHRVDLFVEGGCIVYLWPDGSMANSGQKWIPPEQRILDGACI